MTDQERYHSARRDPDLVVIEGFHALKHALRFGAALIDVVSDDAARLGALGRDLAPDLVDALEDLSSRGVLRTLGTAAFDALSPAPIATRVAAIATRPRYNVAGILDMSAAAPVVVLDQPRHAGNIGAAVRVAAAAGAGALITTGPADPWSAASVRGGAGLQFALPVARAAIADGVVCDGMRALLDTRRMVVAVDPAGSDLHPGSASPGAVLVFGSERDGISPALLDRADMRVRIPMRPGVSSLNLATAVAAILYGPPFGTTPSA